MKKALTIAVALGLAAALSFPAAAQEPAPTAIPEVVNIEDPAGDANYLNGQGLADDGDHVTPADAGSVSDLLKVWFSHDTDVVRAHFLTELPPPATASAYIFRVRVDAAGDTNCLWFQILTTGPTNPLATEATGSLRNLCNDADESLTEGITVTIEETADGQGISTISVPRSLHPALVDGSVLSTPVAEIRNYFNANAPRSLTAPQIDDTRPGTEYTITPAETEPPVKKGCTKGSPKAKKKGCKKS